MADAVGERLGVPRRGRVERQRLYRIVDDQRDVGGSGLEPPLGIDSRVPITKRDNRKPGLNREQEAAALEPRDMSVLASCAFA